MALAIERNRPAVQRQQRHVGGIERADDLACGFADAELGAEVADDVDPPLGRGKWGRRRRRNRSRRGLRGRAGGSVEAHPAQQPRREPQLVGVPSGPFQKAIQVGTVKVGEGGAQVRTRAIGRGQRPVDTGRRSGLLFLGPGHEPPAAGGIERRAREHSIVLAARIQRAQRTGEARPVGDPVVGVLPPRRLRETLGGHRFGVLGADLAQRRVLGQVKPGLVAAQHLGAGPDRSR